MAVKSRMINNKWCRYYRDGYIWVPEDGSSATTLLDGHYKKLKILKDSEGLWAKHPWGHHISMARAVITCYCPPVPTDGQSYMIGYKDGDIYNCSKQNLIWVPYHYIQNTNDSAKLQYYDSEILVYKDGSIYVDKNKATLCDYISDPDIDRHVVIKPHVRISIKNQVSMDEIMKDAGFIKGDDAGMSNPRILHIDNDRLNFNSDNLVFVEAADCRYKEYLKKEAEDKNKRLYELNSGLEIHDFMLYK